MSAEVDAVVNEAMEEMTVIDGMATPFDFSVTFHSDIEDVAVFCAVICSDRDYFFEEA